MVDLRKGKIQFASECQNSDEHLPNNEEVGVIGFLTEERSSNEIVVESGDSLTGKDRTECLEGRIVRRLE